jgi:uncharacterized surface protein with fasciclin (FAS1) repeats
MSSLTKFLVLAVILMLAGIPLVAQSETRGALVETLATLDDAQLFNEAVQITGINAELTREPHTIFVPVDTAFSTTLADLNIDLAALEDDSVEMRVLTAIVRHHVIIGKLPVDDFRAGQIMTLQGDKLTFRQTEASITINDAEVVASHAVEEGILHEVSATLMPTLCDGLALNGGLGARLGPGFNRGRIGYLPADIYIPVTGQFTTSDGLLWYRLDKTIATPNKQVAEVWTLAENLTTSGVACELIPVVQPN